MSLTGYYTTQDNKLLQAFWRNVQPPLVRWLH